MLRTLHRVVGFFFYLLGSTFFLAALLLRNAAGGGWPLWWIQIADLPLALSAILYAGLSLYESVRPAEKHSRALAVGITVPLITFFLLIATLNFWPA